MKFRGLLQAPDIVTAPLVSDGMTARLVEQAFAATT
jgi:2-methylisocitrate lyase-like PEP mutase family enzyme